MVKSMSARRGRSVITLAALLAGPAFEACSSGPPPENGACTVAPDACTSGPDAGANATQGLTGYACTGTASPDDYPTYVDGVPRGAVCSDRGAKGNEKH